jgi:zinc protease
MRFARVLCLPVILAAGLLQGQGLLPEVQELQLKNGLRVYLVERPGTGAVHASLFLNSGKAGTGALPPAASLLLARCLFAPQGIGEQRNPKALESALKVEEGTFEALRLERIRQARHPGGGPTGELAGLELLERQAYDAVQAQLGPAVPGVPGMTGDGRPDLRVEADQVSWSVEVPRAAFESCCRSLADRLRAPLLARYPIERERLLQEIGTGDGSDPKALGILLNTALPGRVYARSSDLWPSQVASIPWSALRGMARELVVPDRLFLVLVGDLRKYEIPPMLERTLGELKPGQKGTTPGADESMDLGQESGPRRLQASLPGPRRIYFAWQIPPITHSDRFGLQILARMLGDSAGSRLVSRLKEEQSLAAEVTVRLNVPGGRGAGLLVIGATPAGRHELPELEQAIQGELIRLQRGGFQDGEIRRVQRQVEVSQLALQEDAAELARAMGTALCQGGDWRLAFNALEIKRDITTQELQEVARRYLAPGRSTIVQLEQDPVFSPQDRLEERLVALLTQILEAKLGSPGQAQSVVRDTVRQLRLLPRTEREEALKLLESQVKP